MPTFERDVIRAGNVKEIQPKILKLDVTQKKELAQLVTDTIPFMTAIREAANSWPEGWLKEIVNMRLFKKYCITDALDQSDEDLMGEAKRYAGPDKVKEILDGPEPGFGTL